MTTRHVPVSHPGELRRALTTPCLVPRPQGGYSERDDDRGYTFGWWHLVDTFI